MSWWRQLDLDRSKDAEKAAQLVNVLAKLKGSRETKLRWLEKLLPLLEAEAAKKFDPAEQPREFGAEMVSLTYRFWRARVRQQKPRPGSAELPQDPGPRDGEMTRVADVLPLFGVKE